MRLAAKFALFALLLSALSRVSQVDAAGPTNEDTQATRINVTVNIPSPIESFDDAALVAILYEFDPRLADVGAREVEKVVIRNLGHQDGIEQSLRFTLGDSLQAVRNDRQYYVSCRIYQDIGEDAFQQGQQLHYCHNEHDRLPGTVYDEQNSKSPVFVAR